MNLRLPRERINTTKIYLKTSNKKKEKYHEKYSCYLSSHVCAYCQQQRNRHVIAPFCKINQAKLFQKPYHTNNTTFYPFDQETRMYFAEQYEQKERTIPKKTSNRLTDPKLKKALWNNDILLSNIAEQNKAINKLLKEGDSLPPIHVEYLINTINLIENSLRN